MIQILPFTLQPMVGSSQHHRPWSKLGRSWSRFYHSDSSQWKALLNTTTLIHTLKLMTQILPLRLQPMEGSSQHYRHWSKLGRSWSRFYHSDSSQWKTLLNTTDIDPKLVGHALDFTIQTSANGRLFSTIQILSQLGRPGSRFNHLYSGQWKALLNTTDIDPNLVGHSFRLQPMEGSS